MQEVEIRLVANNQNAVKGVRELNSEAEKLSKTEEKQNTKRKGFIQQEEARLKHLKKLRDETFNENNLKFYNREIERVNKNISEYEKAGLDAQKQTDSLSSSISKWALSIGGAALILNKLKDALKETTAGLNLFNQVGAVTKQVLNDIVSGAGLSIDRMRAAAIAQRELNKERVQESIDLKRAKEQQVLYNKYYFESADRTKSDTERLHLLNKALEAHNKMIDIQIENAKRLIAIKESQYLNAPASETARKEWVDAKNVLDELEIERTAGVKRVESQRTSIIQDEIETRKRYYENLNAWLLAIEEGQIEAERKKSDESKKIVSEYYQWLLNYLKQVEKAKKENTDIAHGFIDIDPGRGTAILERLMNKPVDPVVGPGWNQLKLNKTLNDLNKKLIEEGVDNAKAAEDQDFENKQKRVEAIKSMISELASITQDIMAQSVADAQRTRELLDTQISEAQQSLDNEVELYKEGFASSVTAKKQQVEELKKLREKALKDEEEAIRKQKQFDTIQQTGALITASAQTFKAFPGPLLPIAIAVVASMFAAFAAAKIRARDTVKLASGGHGMVDGRLHSEGGEPFLSHVEVEQGERWGVLSRNASRRYGKVFANMVDSFNKNKLPKGVTNNIVLDTTSTNSRLERVEGQLIKLNRYFEGQEQTADNGGRSISKKGNTVRVIKHK